MTNNANIQARFIDLLNILDARAVVTVFELQEDGTQKIVFDYMTVWEILASFLPNDLLKKYDVIGLNLGINSDILIKKAV